MTFYHFGLYEMKEEYESKWLKIFHHNSSGINFFSPNEAKFNVNDPNKYSILKLLPRIRRYNSSQYEFLLEYPGHDGYNRWKQNRNPLEVRSPISNTEIGFTPINLAWKDSFFSGLALSSYTYISSTFMDCSANTSGRWHYAIGSYESWDEEDKFPGSAEFNVREALLYIRIKDFFQIFNPLCTININYGIKIVIFPSVYIIIFIINIT